MVSRIEGRFYPRTPPLLIPRKKRDPDKKIAQGWAITRLSTLPES